MEVWGLDFRYSAKAQQQNGALLSQKQLDVNRGFYVLTCTRNLTIMCASISNEGHMILSSLKPPHVEFT